MDVRTDQLKAKISGIKGNTMTAKLRPLMPEIDAKIREGVRHNEIVAALAEEGIELPLETLRTILYRYRAQVRAAGGTSATPTPTTEANGNSPVEAGETDDTEGQSEVTFEDAIDARKRDQFSDKFMMRKPPIFGNKSKRSDDK